RAAAGPGVQRTARGSDRLRLATGVRSSPYAAGERPVRPLLATAHRRGARTGARAGGVVPRPLQCQRGHLSGLRSVMARRPDGAPPPCGSWLSRRDMLRRAGFGFGAWALLDLLTRDGLLAANANPLAAKPPHFPARAKHVIFLFMQGGPSHIDTFDSK